MGTFNTNGPNAIKKVGRKMSVFHHDTEILKRTIDALKTRYTIYIQDKLPILVSDDGCIVNNNNV